MATTYLSRTQGTPTSRKIFTYSAWIKICELNIYNILFESADGSHNLQIVIQDNGNGNDLRVYDWDGTVNLSLRTSQGFRDVSAWYHIVLAVDTTQATASNRAKFYVNGEQVTSFSTAIYPSQNYDTAFTNGKPIQIGRQTTSSDYFNGSMAHVHFIDGLAYPASTFGETDSLTGIWKPITSPSVTYGNNGFFLKFANSSLMGTDSSGEGNDYTVNGNLTQTQDTPSNVFATLNVLDTSRGLSNGNTTYAGASSGTVVKGTLAVTSGKYYAECKILDASENMIGVLDIGQAPTTNYVGYSSVGWGIFTSNGNIFNSGANSSYSDAFSDNDIMGIALDMDNNKLYFSKNGTWQNSGVPTSGATGTGAISITSGLTMTFCGGRDSASDTASFNFGNGYFGTTAVASAGTNASGNGIFEYDVPTGYTALSTKGLNL